MKEFEEAFKQLGAEHRRISRENLLMGIDGAIALADAAPTLDDLRRALRSLRDTASKL